jgi:hypothetical protein
MRAAIELKAFVREAANLLRREKDLAAFEVYCSSSEHRVLRLNYTSDIPSRGVEEFKSLDADGFAVRIVVIQGDKRLTGSGWCAGELTLDSVRATLARARESLIDDPHFPGLPGDPRKLKPADSRPDALMRASDRLLASAAWKIVGDALTTFGTSAPLKLPRPGLVIGGDLSVIRDRIALSGSGLAEIRSDESAYFSSSVTVLIESLGAKGTASALGSSLEQMNAAANRLGREAAIHALKLRHGERPSPGNYRVVLGPQPVAEIINYMVMPSLTTHAFQAASSAYYGRFGKLVMDERIMLADDPLAEIGAVRRRITCEGLPAQKTVLINQGRLTGLLSTYYDTHRLLSDEACGEKLGATDCSRISFPPASAYRLGESVARRFDARPGATGTNVVMHARGGVSERELLGAVDDGLYIGRVWYTYPINGQRAGDFTCTISGDSQVIRGGRLAAPLAPNCLRINANIRQIFAHPIAIARRSEPSLVWGSAEAYYVPALAVGELSLTSVEGP